MAKYSIFDSMLDRKVRLAVDWNKVVRNYHQRAGAFGNFPSLSHAVSAYQKLNRQFAEEFEHLDDYGKGHECGGILAAAQHNAFGKFYKEAGFTEEELFDAVSERTSDRWAHFHL